MNAMARITSAGTGGAHSADRVICPKPISTILVGSGAIARLPGVKERKQAEAQGIALTRRPETPPLSTALCGPLASKYSTR